MRRERRDFVKAPKFPPSRVWSLQEAHWSESGPDVQLVLTIYDGQRSYSRVVARLNGGGIHLIEHPAPVPLWATRAGGFPPETVKEVAPGCPRYSMLFGLSPAPICSYDDCEGNYEGPEENPRGRQIISDEQLRNHDEETHLKGVHPSAELGFLEDIF